MSKISELIKEKAIGFVFNLVSLLVIVVVLLLVIYVFAAFIEPSSAPSASNQDFAQNILGADNSNNTFASTNVVANADGSIIERLQDLLAKIALDSEIGGSGDAASMASTLFGGQQYIWDNRASFGTGVTERGTDNAALASNYTATRAGYLDKLAVSRPTMYQTSATFAGNHNCDDSPATCCASGYHMCDASEIQGSRVETSGTGRDTTPGGVGDGWLDRKSGLTSAAFYSDCSDWSSNSGSFYGGIYGYAGQSESNAAFGYHPCSESYQVWCCGD